MPEVKEEKAKTYDPFESFRGMRDAYLDAMSKTMIETVNSEGYAQASGTMLDCYLTASAPFREAAEKSMLQAMQQLALPSRQDVTALAERFTNLEMRMDDLDAKIDQVLKVLAGLRTAEPAQSTTAKPTPAPQAARKPAAARR